AIIENTRIHDPVQLKYLTVKRDEWKNKKDEIYHLAHSEIQFPMVIKPANQGSSIGVSVLKTNNKDNFVKAVENAFFTRTLSATEWNSLSDTEKIQWAKQFSDIRENIGLPAIIENTRIHDPVQLIEFLNQYLSIKSEAIIEAIDADNEIIIEEFIDGKEFSCIVIEDEHGKPIALPPTEIIKKDILFDYKSKYLPGLSRKITPIDLPEEQIQSIREETQRMFLAFKFDVYARIDGFITPQGKIYLNDPNTTSGMMPSSFFFHQAAEIGLNPSQFLTYIIFISLKKRQQQALQPAAYQNIIQQLANYIHSQNQLSQQKKLKTAIIMGGYSTERHISVESGRNVYEKLSSSEKYIPFPIFLLKANNHQGFEMYSIPIRLMLKDNADDIKDKILNYQVHP
ncbi:MAG: D-alanine--D-alanine ligase, partial [Bacteroidetes bacterium]